MESSKSTNMRSTTSTTIKIILSAIILLVSFGLSAQTGNHVEGTGAGDSITSGDYLTMVGDSAGHNHTSGLRSTYLGFKAGFSHTNQTDNTFIGAYAGEWATTGTDNVFIGTYAGRYCDGTDNTVIGVEAGMSMISGASDNTIIGEEAGQALLDGDDNVFIGEDAGYNTTTASDNTFVGNTAGRSNTTGYANAFFGDEAGYDNTTGYWNTAVGDSALIDCGVGYANTAIGHGAGCATEHGDQNTFVGSYAGGDNNRTNYTSTANRNTYLGNSTGFTNRKGSDNVGIGAGSDFSGTDQSRCVFIGETGYITEGQRDGDGFHMVGSNDATSIGYQSQTSAQYGIGIGHYQDQHGVQSVSMGYSTNTESAADYSVLIGSTGYLDEPYTTGIGYNATITGENSISLGAFSSVTGDSSIVIGTRGSVTDYGSIGLGNGVTVSGYNSIAIGYGTTISADNEVFIGNSAITSIGGNVNWTATSDGRFKTNVQENVPGLDFIRQLSPVTYNFDLDKLNDFNHSNGLPTAHKTDVVYSGFIAQDVLETAKELGYDFSGIKVPENEESDLYGIRYAEFVVPLVKATQELEEKVEAQQLQINQQQDLLLAQQELIKKYNVMLAESTESMTKLKSDMISLEAKVDSEYTPVLTANIIR